MVWWWVLGLGFAPPRPLWCGWWGLGFRCIDMKGFRVEGQQLGAAQTETVANPGECRHFGHATKLHSFKSHNTHEDPGFGEPIPVTVGTFETKVRPSRGFRVYRGTPLLAPLVCFLRPRPVLRVVGLFTWVVQPPLVPLLCSGLRVSGLVFLILPPCGVVVGGGCWV